MLEKLMNEYGKLNKGWVFIISKYLLTEYLLQRENGSFTVEKLCSNQSRYKSMIANRIN